MTILDDIIGIYGTLLAGLVLIVGRAIEVIGRGIGWCGEQALDWAMRR